MHKHIILSVRLHNMYQKPKISMLEYWIIHLMLFLLLLLYIKRHILFFFLSCEAYCCRMQTKTTYETIIRIKIMKKKFYGWWTICKLPMPSVQYSTYERLSRSGYTFVFCWPFIVVAIVVVCCDRFTNNNIGYPFEQWTKKYCAYIGTDTTNKQNINKNIKIIFFFCF